MATPATAAGVDKRVQVLGSDADGVGDAHVRERAGVAERVHGRRADAESPCGFAHGQKPLWPRELGARSGGRPPTNPL